MHNTNGTFSGRNLSDDKARPEDCGAVSPFSPSFSEVPRRWCFDCICATLRRSTVSPRRSRHQGERRTLRDWCRPGRLGFQIKCVIFPVRPLICSGTSPAVSPSRIAESHLYKALILLTAASPPRRPLPLRGPSA